MSWAEYDDVIKAFPTEWNRRHVQHTDSAKVTGGGGSYTSKRLLQRSVCPVLEVRRVFMVRPRLRAAIR